jgi:hypothetical protein
MPPGVGRDHLADEPDELPEAGDNALPWHVEPDESAKIDRGHRRDNGGRSQPSAPVDLENVSVAGLNRRDLDLAHARRPFERRARRRYWVAMSIAITTAMIMTRMALTSE